MVAGSLIEIRTIEHLVHGAAGEEAKRQRGKVALPLCLACLENN